MPERDPTDEIHDAARALAGIVDLLTETDGMVDRRGLEYLLRLVEERLSDAVERMLLPPG